MRGLVDLRAGERRGTLSAFLGLLGITGAHTMLETARDALFLAKLPPTRLPWVYLAIALIGLGLARVAKKSGGGGRTGVTASLLGAALVTVGFWVASARMSDPFLYALYVWSGIFASWVVVQFWLLIGAVFTVAQAKRLFGFIGAGSVLGAVVGAAVARALAGQLPARHLLIAGAGLLVVTALGPAAMLKAPVEATPKRKPAASASSRAGLGADVRLAVEDPYVKRILLLILVSTVALTTVDYLFKSAVAREVPKERLGEYFAGVYVVLNALALVVQLGVVSVVFRLAGIHRALWVLPLCLIGGSAAVMLGGGLTAALLLKGADGTLRHSLHKTSTELLYVPIADAIRTRIKPVIDLVGQRGGQALASLVILGLVSVGTSDRTLAILVGALVAAWLLVAATIQRPYLDVFRQALREGRIEQAPDLPDLDLAALEALFGALNSRKDAEVIGAMDLLAAQKRQRLIPALILYHPSKAIVLRALELFTAEGRSDYLPITDRLLEHADADVRAAALRARAATEADDTLLRKHLADERPEVRATALVTLLSHRDSTKADAEARGEDVDLGWPSDLETMLAELAGDPSPAVRAALARAIEAEPTPRFEDTLVRLAARIREGETEVGVAVAAAMGRVGTAALIEPLVAMLASRERGHAAREALVRFGEPALNALASALERSDLPRDVRWKLPRAVAAFEPELAAPVLLAHLDRAPEGMVRFRIVRGLMRLRRVAPDLPLDREVLTRAAKETLHASYGLIADRGVLERGAIEEPSRRTPAHQLLTTLLSDKQTHALGRLFMLLGLLYPEENFERIHRGLRSDSAKTRASSRELCDNIVSGELKAPLMILIDDLSDDQRLDRVGTFFVAPPRTYEGLLDELFDRAGELSSLAAYHAAELGLSLSGGPKSELPGEVDALTLGLVARAPSRPDLTAEAADAG
jgi:AAA family ATP:ADP antiporter